MFQWFDASVTRELPAGDVIGDHTETHPIMAELSPFAQQSEIVDQTQWRSQIRRPVPAPVAPAVRLRQRGDARDPRTVTHADDALDRRHRRYLRPGP